MKAGHTFLSPVPRFSCSWIDQLMKPGRHAYKNRAFALYRWVQGPSATW